jgi:hypothetical protein
MAAPRSAATELLRGAFEPGAAAAGFGVADVVCSVPGFAKRGYSPQIQPTIPTISPQLRRKSGRPTRR